MVMTLEQLTGVLFLVLSAGQYLALNQSYAHVCTAQGAPLEQESYWLRWLILAQSIKVVLVTVWRFLVNKHDERSTLDTRMNVNYGSKKSKGAKF